jgi:UDP-2,3-diacylglucosamine pyrophosphatase LpxH
MDLKADILFKDVVPDTDLEEVQRQLQCCVNEWFFPEVTKTMPEIRMSVAPPLTWPGSTPQSPSTPMSVPQFEPLDEPFANQPPIAPIPFAPITISSFNPQPQSKVPARNVKQRPLYVVSDLHLGDGGPRDNFAHMSNRNRQVEFEAFLDFVEEHNGQFIILGDFFELWQSNMSKVITFRTKLLDRLAKMEAIYVLGNHDADLLYFCGNVNPWLTHPFFLRMRRCHTATIGGRHFHFIHGHEVDKYCAGDVPGVGRITAIYSGLKEDRNGSPLRGKYPSITTVEKMTVGKMERFITFIRRLCGKPGRFEELNRQLVLLRERGKYDVLVSGHTHRAGKIAGHPIYNTGTWAEDRCSFVVVTRAGEVGVFDWVDGKPTPNNTKL